jgi:hypothetical protein
MDWEIHRTRKFGIPTIHLEDVAITESQGAIADRRRENLTQADGPIIAVRKKLLEAAKALRNHGIPAPCAHQGSLYRGIRGRSVILPRDIEWSKHVEEEIAVHP